MKAVRLALIALSALSLPVAAPAQKDPPKKPDPAVKEKLQLFEEAITHKHFALDPKAIQIMEELSGQYAGMHPKDQSAFLESLDKVFKVKKRKPNQPALYEATVFTLGTIGGSSASEILTEVYDKKPFNEKEWASLQQDILENIGRTKDEGRIEFLVDRATKDPDDPVKAKAGGALRHYSESDQKERRDIVKMLLRDYAKIEGDSKTQQVNSEIGATRKRTLAAIRGPWNETLSTLTGQHYNTAEDWQRWWNKNKDGKW